MSRPKPKIIVTRHLPSCVETRMKELFDVELNATDKPFSHDELVEAVSSADILVSTVTDSLNADIFAHSGSKLRMIAQFGAGVDNIDLPSVNTRNIMLTNTPGVLTDDTADMAIALILAIPRRLVEGIRALEQGKFYGWSPTWMMGHRLKGKRLGIIGMGRIGQAIARRARVFGLQIHYHNRNRVSRPTEEALEATYWDSIDQMLAHMDIISINCPHTPETDHLLSAERLQLMKPDAYLINTARGKVVDEAALADMIADGKLGGAGLDVFEKAPEVNPKLKSLPNVVLVPHLGSATLEARMEMGEKVLINIRAFIDGHTPPDRVIPEIQ